MSASTFCGVIDFDRLDSGPGSPNVEGEFSTWGLEAPTFHSSTTGKSSAVVTDPVPPPEDPSCPVRGMYRLLDLIMEQGTNGLVDKIVIAQQPLQAFINALSPGSYSSVSKVNFKILDDLLLKPIGVYGSKEELVKFLREMGAVDAGMAWELLVPQRDYTKKGAEPILRTGLYAIRTFMSTSQEQVYILYWPEDTTWDDNEVSTVQHHRVTFMRYLSKICDQLVCLLSAEHSQAIVWGDGKVYKSDASDTSLDSDIFDSDRLFNFTVEKKSEQEENVTARQGFMMSSSRLVSGLSTPKTHLDESVLSPRLLHGETTQGFMTADFRTTFEPFSHDHMSASQIRQLIEEDVVLCPSETLDDTALKILMRICLSTRFPKESESWEERRVEIEKRFQKTHTKRHEEIPAGTIQDMVRGAVIGEILKAFPVLQGDRFSSRSSSASQAEDALLNIFSIYPKAELTFRGSIRALNLDKGIDGGDFQSKKERMLILLYLLQAYKGLNTNQIRTLCNDVLVVGDEQKTLGLLKSFAVDGNANAVLSEEAIQGAANNYAASISDLRFLSYVKTIPSTHFLYDAAVECEDTAYDCLTTQLDSLVHEIHLQILSIQKEECDKKAQHKLKKEEEREKELKESRAKFVRQIADLCRARSTSRNSIHIEELKIKKGLRYSPDLLYIISGRKESWQNQEIEYTVHLLHLLADERHNLQLDISYVPTPVLNEQPSQKFYVSSENVVKYAHLLEGDRILLGLVDSQGNLMILLDHLSCIDDAIRSRSYSKFFHRDKIGQTCLLAFDESKRMLAVCRSARMLLHVFQFDEEFKFLRGFGAQIDLSPFYNAGASITHACFVHGNEEILFIDSRAQARTFSLTTSTLQPEPAALQLSQIPRAIYSTPDGSCLLVVQDEAGKHTITAYHWSTFASHSGISVALPDFPVDLGSALLTSIVNRNNIHLVGLDLSSGSCRSVVLDITRKGTEFTSEEWGSKGPSSHGKQTVHNCLIDCHRDVWTRFPVVSPVKHQIITSSSQRRQKTLVFVTDVHWRPFYAYFCDMISSFEKVSRKPTGDELESIAVSARPFPTWTEQCIFNPDWPVSCFRAGEWLAALLCLIPIHIAVTHKNRLVPLKDGLVSLPQEQSQFGDVNRIVDSLTLGWYEPIFRSYWTSKPVKVVSSMGEQSVGKSFALNHLVDTSFGGSTTEGVWMSVSPTEDTLIVALDFEGVHSLSHSEVEDKLLVLLNTAISNLVLFRKNFALSRNISDLSQADSFQSSSSVLDPASNPSLFQSTLVVIIKDVINTDTREVVKEFALNIQRIAPEKRDANFISRLHRELQIIPWPVIGSREFYTLFSAVKQKLDREKTSHHTAGEFLLTLKTLMAKLKSNDWRAMSQTMAALRASSLLAILPVALQTGNSQVVPELEPLKSFDTDIEVEAEDTEARFLLAGPDTPAGDRERHLSVLIESWDRSGTRQQVGDSEWMSGLVEHLTHLVDLRVAHVEEWLKSNTQRFQADNARSMEELRRAFDSAVIDLRASIRLCKSECDDCNLLCIQSSFHDGVHNCLTSHDCIHKCTFCDKQLPFEKACGQIAGHNGGHVCRVDVHLCGKPCKLLGKQGCSEECIKTVQHGGDHICSAPLHICGQPCNLIDLKLPDGKSFTCPGKCRVPINKEHTFHACEDRLCPISCQLCKRLCSRDHLHGRSPGENHLCGEEHLCSALCSADGICEIDTIPRSIEATFPGRDETFQYTKYSMTAKRLNCVKIIKPGAIEHDGFHIHSNDHQPFHYCEGRCKTCDYLCILPSGHTQQEHETYHGSTSRTRWEVDGREGSCSELGGHKFSSNNDGAPMLCNLECTSIGRHVHIDDCRGDPHDPEAVHINKRIAPNPEKSKDLITHRLHWRRLGFKDPYLREDQANFAKCDVMCPGPEHTVEGGGPNARPSYCTMPMFHLNTETAKAPADLGYVSNDGHHFECKNPIMMQQSFHIIFVIDRSRSMGLRDQQPLPDSAGIDRILPKANNRFGAVLSALYSFWIARHDTVDPNSPVSGRRMDAYSLIFFNHEPSTSIENDFTSSPYELLTAALDFEIDGGTDFTSALERTQELMLSHWSKERTPVVIFLSDGEDCVKDEAMYKICRSAASRGRRLSFHAVSFGEESSLSSLRRMAEIALETQKNGASNPLHPTGANVLSSYTEALDTVGLQEAFLGIAESLGKSHGLFSSYENGARLL